MRCGGQVLLSLLVATGCFWSDPDHQSSLPAPDRWPTEFELSTHRYTDEGRGTLELDLRIPRRKRVEAPGILFVHGGGFSDGQRNAGAHVRMLDTLANLGFTSASISYTLSMKEKGFGCDVPAQEKQEAVERAAAELMLARQWLDGTTLDVPGSWVAMGSSAGAETVMWAGFGLAPEAWKGIIAFSGAIADATPIPSHPPAFLAIHGTCDPVVPPRQAVHRGCRDTDAGAWMLCGGLGWSDRMALAGHPSRSLSYCGGNHRVCSTALNDPRVLDIMTTWMTTLDPDGHAVQEWIPAGSQDGPGDQPCADPCQ